MNDAKTVFVHLYEGGIRLRVEGGELAFKALEGRALSGQVALMKQHKAALLAIVDHSESVCAMVDGVAVELNTPDPRRRLHAMAKARGFPPVQLEETIVDYGLHAWTRFAFSAPEADVFDAMLRLDDYPVEELTEVAA